MTAAGSSPTAPILTIRVVSDGRVGIRNQALGLAEAVARRTPARIQDRKVRWKRAFDWLPADLKRRFMLDDATNALDGDPPELWIAAGRASLPLSLWMRQARAPRPFVVQIQDPRLDPARFDMVVAPAHDELTGANVLSIIGSPHRITPDRLTQAAPVYVDQIGALPHPRIVAMIGGKSKAFDLTDDHATALAERIADTVTKAGGSLLLTFSRRTPESARKIMTRRLRTLPSWIWRGSGPNPLFAFLEAADHILVTEDSANMAAEAASTGKPVHILPMAATGAGDKFARLHESLSAHGAARPFSPPLQTWRYAPLAETDRAAEAVLKAMAARG